MHTISRVKRIKDDKWMTTCGGFSNNILWQAGHIYMIVESFLKKGIPTYEMHHSEWLTYFDDGTSPKDWDVDVPTGNEILQQLYTQLDWVIPFLETKLDEKMAEPIIIGNNVMTIDTMEGLVQFLSWHEGTHAGVIYTLNNVECKAQYNDQGDQYI